MKFALGTKVDIKMARIMTTINTLLNNDRAEMHAPNIFRHKG